MSWRASSQPMSQSFVDSSQTLNTSSQYRRGKLSLGKNVASLNDLIGSNIHSFQQSAMINSQNSSSTTKLNSLSSETQQDISSLQHQQSLLQPVKSIVNTTQQKAFVNSTPSDSLVQTLDKQKLFGKLDNLEKRLESTEKYVQSQLGSIHELLLEIKAAMQHDKLELHTNQRQMETLQQNMLEQYIQAVTGRLEQNYNNMNSVFCESIQSLAQEIKNLSTKHEPHLIPPLSPALYSAENEPSLLITRNNNVELCKKSNLEDRIREKIQHTQTQVPWIWNMDHMNKSQQEDLFANDSTLIQEEEEEQLQPVTKRCKRR